MRIILKKNFQSKINIKFEEIKSKTLDKSKLDNFLSIEGEIFIIIK